jgi:hypothetical protein
MITLALAYVAGCLTVFFWTQIKAKLLAAYDWLVAKI